MDFETRPLDPIGVEIRGLCLAEGEAGLSDAALARLRRTLVDEGLVSQEEWQSAKEQGPAIVETLLSRGNIDEGAFMEVLGRAAGVAPLDLNRVSPDPSAVECLPEATCHESGVLPISKNGNILTIAVSDPFDVLLFDDIKRRTGCHIRTVFAHPGMLTR